MIVRISAVGLALILTACSNSVARDEDNLANSDDFMINTEATLADDSTSPAPMQSVDNRLADARGIPVQELNDPARHYGYTAEDRAFLKEHGMSEEEARAAERVLCEHNVDC